ncbi:plasmodesmata-located protein 8 [Daucus carota subsp. sativus]|uniref:plasmodesmata-located protein 8 n=1 Tax=Daucus carota subsp. sativus TaxID=79200 RepID=UPI0030831EFE
MVNSKYGPCVDRLIRTEANVIENSCPAEMRSCISLITILLLCGILLMNTADVLSDPQTKLLKQVCSQFKIGVNMSDFLSNFNKTFLDIREQMSNNRSIHFATAEHTNLYGMVQCRNYLSHGDCVACLDAASSQVRKNCSTANGGQVIYEGCFLRYETRYFFTLSPLDTFGSFGKLCSTSKSIYEATSFTPAVTGLITDLVEATPKIKGFFSVTKRPVFYGSRMSTVNAVAQCIETISQKDCHNCLKSGYMNIQSCPPASEGSSLDANCFLRYSDTTFFSDNSTIDLTAYLREGSSSSKTAIIGGAVGGLCLLLVLAALFYYQLVRKPYIARQGIYED